jgi:capsular exopolysaccharide synthesis family protein
MASHEESSAATDWLRPPSEQAGLRFYVEVLRERIWIVIITAALTLLAAGAYLLTAEKVYEAEAELLITPVPSDDPVLASLGLPRASADPTRDVETAAALANSIDVAERVKDQLGLEEPARSLLRNMTAEPVATSNLVTIITRASSPERAAALANAFAEATVEDRTQALHDQIDRILPELQATLKAGGSAVSPTGTVEAQIAQLELLRAGTDPTVRLETEALPPQGPASPRRLLTIAGAVLAGLVLGVAAAFAAQTLDPRLRREQQLRSRYSLPILARVPRDSGRRDRPLGPGMISPPTREAYRTLRANIAAARRKPDVAHSVLVTGSAPAEGKTSTALNLAASMALAGDRVILIEADLRRPAIARTLGVDVERGVVSTLLENVSLDDALMTTAPFGPNLKLLLAEYAGGWMSELFSLHAAQRLLEEAKQRADFVILDSPPLTVVVDTLPLARAVDDVLIVTRLGVSRLDKLQELAELLASNDIVPVGFTLVGTPRPESYEYYHRGAGIDARGEVSDLSVDHEPEPERSARASSPGR